jgi:hypothetical protein
MDFNYIYMMIVRKSDKHDQNDLYDLHGFYFKRAMEIILIQLLFLKTISEIIE